jgi:hypothetical protein
MGVKERLKQGHEVLMVCLAPGRVLNKRIILVNMIWWDRVKNLYGKEDVGSCGCR